VAGKTGERAKTRNRHCADQRAITAKYAGDAAGVLDVMDDDAATDESSLFYGQRAFTHDVLPVRARRLPYIDREYPAVRRRLRGPDKKPIALVANDAVARVPVIKQIAHNCVRRTQIEQPNAVLLRALFEAQDQVPAVVRDFGIDSTLVIVRHLVDEAIGGLRFAEFVEVDCRLREVVATSRVLPVVALRITAVPDPGIVPGPAQTKKLGKADFIRQIGTVGSSFEFPDFPVGTAVGQRVS
jgi:hypothetical protein